MVPSLVELLYVFDSDHVHMYCYLRWRATCGRKRRGELFIEYEDELESCKEDEQGKEKLY